MARVICVKRCASVVCQAICLGDAMCLSVLTASLGPQDCGPGGGLLRRDGCGGRARIVSAPPRNFRGYGPHLCACVSGCVTATHGCHWGSGNGDMLLWGEMTRQRFADCTYPYSLLSLWIGWGEGTAGGRLPRRPLAPSVDRRLVSRWRRRPRFQILRGASTDCMCVCVCVHVCMCLFVSHSFGRPVSACAYVCMRDGLPEW